MRNEISRKSFELGVGGPGTQTTNLSLINRVTLNKSCYLSEPSFPTSEVRDLGWGQLTSFDHFTVHSDGPRTDQFPHLQ